MFVFKRVFWALKCVGALPEKRWKYATGTTHSDFRYGSSIITMFQCVLWHVYNIMIRKSSTAVKRVHRTSPSCRGRPGPQLNAKFTWRSARRVVLRRSLRCRQRRVRRHRSRAVARIRRELLKYKTWLFSCLVAAFTDEITIEVFMVPIVVDRHE